MKTLTLINPKTSVDSAADGTVLLTMRGPYDGKTGACNEVRVHLAYDEYLTLLADLANHARHAVGTVIDDLVIGPCEKCKNSRMLDMPTGHGDRTTKVHCDCVAGRRDGYPTERTFRRYVHDTVATSTFPSRGAHRAYTESMVWEEEAEDGHS